MHVNFGLYPPLENAPRNKAARHAALVDRARRDLEAFLLKRADLFGTASS